MFTIKKEAKPQCRRPSRQKTQLVLGDVVRGGRLFPLTLIRMTKDEKGLAFFKGLLL
jgi:hypothetical protein